VSGIVGIMNTDGSPVDRGLLKGMTEFMAFRGPDAEETMVKGPVGFGHTMLRTTFESRNECQPISLDGQVWITADVRIDGRDELIAELDAAKCTFSGHATDPELILHAYHVWGNDCVRHLLGDFAFAIWNEAEQCLFCARDHFGVKPFFYASVGGTLLISNTLNCLRLHPDVTDRFEEQALADFLLFGYSRHPDLSAFTDIRRLPPAHFLTWSPDKTPAIRRYWTFQQHEQIRYKRSEDYVQCFLELLHKAVNDRLRTDNVGILMSGGLDSTTVAAAAKEVLLTRSDTCDLRAFTFVYDNLLHDEEGSYAQTVADALAIPMHRLVLDDRDAFQGVSLPAGHMPEPTDAIVPIHIIEQTHRLSDGVRVGLTGQGGDPALNPGPPGFPLLVKGLFTSRLFLDIFAYRLARERWPKIGIRTSFTRWIGARNSMKTPAAYPPWLSDSLERRLNLRQQWSEHNSGISSGNSLRSEAHRSLSEPMWTTVFETYDPSLTCLPLEFRHPFFDLRLMEFMLSLPPVPWCVDKELLRIAMEHILPWTVLQRPKAPLAGFPAYEYLQQGNVPGLQRAGDFPELERFINMDRFLKIASRPERLRPEESGFISRPLGLAVWLENLYSEKSRP